MARVVRVSDFRVMETPILVWPPREAGKETPALPEPPLQRGQEYFMGQVSAVVGLARTNKLNYRETVKQIEKIVHNYEGKNR